MSKQDKFHMYLAIFLMGTSGIAIAVLTEYFNIPTEFGLRAHPATQYSKIFHHFTNIFFIFCVGKIFSGHIQLGILLKKEKKRITGFLITFLIVLLIISGAGILYASNLNLMAFFSNTHWYLGVLFLITFIVHKFLP